MGPYGPRAGSTTSGGVSRLIRGASVSRGGGSATVYERVTTVSLPALSRARTVNDFGPGDDVSSRPPVAPSAPSFSRRQPLAKSPREGQTGEPRAGVGALRDHRRSRVQRDHCAVIRRGHGDGGRNAVDDRRAGALVNPGHLESGRHGDAAARVDAEALGLDADADAPQRRARRGVER